MCANIAIELDGLRLITWRGAARAEHGLPFAGGRAGQKLGTDKGMQIGLDGVQLLGGHGYTRSTRSNAGTAICGPSASPRASWSSENPANGSRLMAINLEMPRKLEAVIEKAHQGAAEMLRPISPQVRPGRARLPVELDTWPRCSRASRRPTPSRSPVPRRSATATRAEGETSTAATCPRCSTRWRSPGVTSRCCCRFRARAGQRRDLRGGHRRTTRAAGPKTSGRRWRSPSRRSAPTRRRCRRRRCSTATST